MLFLKQKKTKQKKNVSWKIRNECLDLIIESSKEVYPKEFGGLLRVDDEKKDLISEVVLIPGTISGDSHAIFKLHMMPVDFNIVGTVHSHPSPSANPSSADLQLFRKHGKIHLIMASPFNKNSWKAYDYRGEQISIQIV
jgi:proteasome lid subunit RPN8/RPN11